MPARPFTALLLLFLTLDPARAQPDTAGSSPLFASDDVLELTLAANLDVLLFDVGEERAEHPAVLSFRAADESMQSVSVEVQTRGRYRRNPVNCPFPPLRLDFDTSEVEGTLFDGQNRIKLVTHCRTDDPGYEQYVLQEYGLYRVFNLLTPRSFLVRLVRMTYRDVTGAREPLTRNAFLIEDDEHVALRLNSELYEEHDVPIDRLDVDHRPLLYLFQYLIGNIDWDVEMRQNLVLTAPSNRGPFSPIPYDFDLAGVIAPPGADRHPNLGPTALRHRLFVDYCGTETDLNPALALFRERKNALYAVFDNISGLSAEHAGATQRYFDHFYRIIDNPAHVEREFLRPCRVRP